MPVCLKRWIGCVALAILAGLAGCDKGGEKPDAGKTPLVEVKKDNTGKIIQGQPVSLARAPKLLPFKDAVLLEPPSDSEKRPPDTTYTGKNAVKIFESIANDLWDKVNFTDAAGKRVRYSAVLATELGDIHIDLHGNLAPNHVRSFVCLARAGYYNGMGFYYSLDRQVEDNRVSYIEAGCPRGTGEFGSGSIGYWLRSEISEQLRHEEGTVGAYIGEEPDSAACRFYITAGAIPRMNGRFTVFGRVTRGLDVVRTINKRAVQEDDRLVQPVVIRNVTILTVPE